VVVLEVEVLGAGVGRGAELQGGRGRVRAGVGDLETGGLAGGVGAALSGVRARVGFLEK